MNLQENLRAIARRAIRFQAVPQGLVLASFFSLVVFASTATSASGQAVNFGSVNVCSPGKATPAPCTVSKTLTFNIPADTNVRSIAIVTAGAPDLDFQAKSGDSSTTPCKIQTYSSATTCTVDVTFAPLTPGLRKGAVELIDGNTVSASSYVYGSGTGPQIAFVPTAQTIPGGTLGEYGPAGIAVDGSENIFFINGDGNLQEILAAGGYSTIKPLGTGFYGRNLAIDGAGNIFATGQGDDTGDNLGHVTELVAASGYTVEKTLPKSFVYPENIAVDSSGNLFLIATPDNFRGQVVDEILASGGYHTVNTVASGFISPSGIAVDASSNIFVSDSYTNVVQEFFAATGYATSQTVYSAEYLQTLAADSLGNLYVTAGAPNSTLEELLAVGGYTTVQPLLGGLNDTQGIATDSSGNVLVGNSTGNGTTGNIYELHRSQPPTLVFPITTVDGASSPQSAKVQNLGNATLTASNVAFTDSADFELVAGSGTPQDCSATFSLAASAECNLNIVFTPQSPGDIAGSLVLNDNSGNMSGATQSISLAGEGSAPVAKVSPTSLEFGSIAYPGTATQSVTVSNTGTGLMTVVPTSNGPSAVISSNTCAAGVAGGKTCTVQVEFKPASLGLHTDTVRIATNAALSPDIPVRGTATGVGSLITQLQFQVGQRSPYEILPLTVTNFGVPGTVTVSTETGAKSFGVYGNGCTTGITPGKSCTILVIYYGEEYGTQTAYLKLIPSTGAQQIIVLKGTNPNPQ